MARLVDSSTVRSNGNSYGRNLNSRQERPLERLEPRERIIKAYGKVSSTGVLPDSNSTSTSVTPTEVEFTLDLYRRGHEYSGEVYIVNYDTRKKLNSNQLIFYQENNGTYALCMFCVTTTNCNCTCSYELVVNLIPSSCSASGMMYAYVAPTYGEGINIGGPLTEGEVIFYEHGSRCNSQGYTNMPRSYLEPIETVENAVECVADYPGVPCNCNHPINDCCD